MNELSKRIAVAALLIPLVLALLYWGGLALTLALGLVSLLCSYEYIRMLRQAEYKVSWLWLAISALSFAVFLLLPGWEIPLMWTLMAAVFADALIAWDKSHSIPRAGLLLLGIFYTGVFPAMIARMNVESSSPNILFWLVILIWITDSSAYFVGMAWGKHKNVTAVSPNKSIEGFIAGAVAPFLITIILYYTNVLNDFALAMLTAFAAGIVGQLGDLGESMIKRYCNVKDSSRMFPGHGGILDRMDSVLFAGSFLYCAQFIIDKVR